MINILAIAVILVLVFYLDIRRFINCHKTEYKKFSIDSCLSLATPMHFWSYTRTYNVEAMSVEVVAEIY